MKTGKIKKLFLIITMTSTTILSAQDEHKTLFDFTVTSNDGSEYDLSQHRGRKVLIVNTASKCGFTPQYEELEQLYRKYGGGHFVIIAFPANNFMNQEPGTDKEIMTFCREHYEVTFPVMSKISVRGKDIHPLYRWLTSKKENGMLSTKVRWNFHKFLIDEEGRPVASYRSRVNPMSDKIVSWIEEGK